MVRAGLQAIYLSGWQVAADANLAGATYPDQSLYPANSVPAVVRRFNNALLRADQIDYAEGRNGTHWLAPILADAEAGFGGPLNAFELMRAMIEAGAAGVHYEDQLSSEKKCGHLGGKVLVPTQQFVRTLNAARLAADVCGVPTVLVARTDALSAALLTSDVDEYDRDFVTGERTAEGFYRVRDGIDAAISRGLAYAPYADLLWFETSTPDLGEAREFAEAIHEQLPGQAARLQLLAVLQLAQAPRRRRRSRPSRSTLGEWGYRFQFITLAGFHSLNAAMFELASGYAEEQMPAYVRLQEREFELEEFGYTATRHQREVGAGYFDLVTQAVAPDSETLALKGSTEEAQFEGAGVSTLADVEILAPADEEVLTREALDLVARLHRELNPRRRELLERRHERQLRARRRRAAALPAGDEGRPRRRLAAWPRRRPISATAAARSPARSTAR